MPILNWLFGKKKATNAQKQGSSKETDNLRRWKESGQARAWCEAHQGQWNHEDWLALLDELSRSPFWPMQSDAVGAVLEELKQEWLRRN